MSWLEVVALVVLVEREEECCLVIEAVGCALFREPEFAEDILGGCVGRVGDGDEVCEAEGPEGVGDECGGGFGGDAHAPCVACESVAEFDLGSLSLDGDEHGVADGLVYREGSARDGVFEWDSRADGEDMERALLVP